MQEYPVVSIITPSYNQANFIRDTIESVLAQDYPHIEHIIVDGGSTDDTLNILKEYGSRIKWISEPDKGQSDAINKGFRMAKGDIVAWLNSDDTYEEGAVSCAVECFHKLPKIGLVYGDGNIINETGDLVGPFVFSQDFNLWSLVHVCDYILQPTTFFSREALVEVGYLDIDLHYCMDWDLWIKLGSKYSVHYVRKTLASSREYGETKTSTGGWERLNEICQLMRKYGSRKYPPGYWFYGVDTISKVLSSIPRLSNWIQIMSGRLLCEYIMKNLSTVYQDGWAGPKCNLWISHTINSEKEITLVLDVPKKIEGSQLTVNEQFFGNLAFGKNIIRIPKSKRENITKINLRCNKSFCPGRSSEGNDLRRLSYLIKNLG